MQLNISKTREMVIDFRKKRKSAFQPLRILGKDVEAVEDYKYVGVTINHSLDWRSNTEDVYKKGMSRLYFLRKLRSFNVCSKMMEIFYQYVVASVLVFAVVCWGSSIGDSDTNRLIKLIRKAGSVVGCKQDTLEAVMERRTLKKLYPSWIILSTLSTSHCSDSGVPSPEDCFSFAVVITDTGYLSCHKPFHYTITLSPPRLYN